VGAATCLLLCAGAAANSQTVDGALRGATGTAAPAFRMRTDASAGTEARSWSGVLALAGIGALGGWGWWRRSRSRLGLPAAARSSAAGLQRVHSQALTQHASVHAVRWNGEEFLLACTSQQVTLIARSGNDGRTGAAG
jgi:hypothetical protein